MKSTKYRILTLIFILTVVVFGLIMKIVRPTTTPAPPTVAAPTPTQENTITLSFENKPNPPYYLGSGESIDWNKPGITLKVLELIKDKLDIKINFIRQPWQRGLDMLKANQIDGVFHASFQADRMEIGVYPMQDQDVNPAKRIMTNAYYLYKLEDSPLQWDGETISNFDGEIGTITGYAIVNDLKDLGVPVYEGENQLDNFRKLARGRLAGVAAIGTMNDFLFETHAQELGNIVKMEPPLKEKDYYLIFSHQFIQQQPHLAAAIWDEIENIRESGMYDRIAQEYIE